MKNKKATLTICIPTFNRCATLMQSLMRLNKSALHENVSVLIIDNDSNDGTYETLTNQELSERYTVLRNQKNIGFAGNFFELLDQCQTEYALFLSDEDELMADELPGICDFLDINRPNFVSPQFYLQDVFWRGKTNTRKIKIREFRESSAHFSGLIFKKDVAIDFSKHIKDMVGSNPAASIYPQVLLASMLLSSGDGYWYDKVLCRQKDQSLKSFIKQDGSDYFAFNDRFEQAIGFLDFFDFIQNFCNSDDQKVKLKSMKRFIEDGFVTSLRSGLVLKNPELVPAFDKGCLKIGLNQFLFFRVLRKLLSVLR